MKKTLLLLVFLCLSTSEIYAKIWRVNNSNGISANFKTVQEAHDGASTGDTLHIEGSPNSYGQLQSSKKLVIIGPGFFLDVNAGLQASSHSAKITYVYYYSGSEGSEIIGIDFVGNVINVYCNDIKILRNKFTSDGSDPESSIGGINTYNEQATGVAVSNIVISQNFGLLVNIDQASTGVLIANNYITGPSHYSGNDQIFRQNQNAVTIVQNNIFKRGKVSVYGSNVSNNIMHSGTLEGTGNLMANNIGSESQFGLENGNKANIDMASVFEGTGSIDASWKLKTGSPAKGAGYGSTEAKPVDAGMFGGPTPYILSGIPPIPSVYFFENQPVGSSTDPIDVSVKVRSNN
jgi:hypothetical protein